MRNDTSNPKLHAVSAQHHGYSQRQTPAQGRMRTVRMRFNQANQPATGDDGIHLPRKDIFAGRLGQRGLRLRLICSMAWIACHVRTIRLSD